MERHLNCQASYDEFYGGKSANGIKKKQSCNKNPTKYGNKLWIGK